MNHFKLVLLYIAFPILTFAQYSPERLAEILNGNEQNLVTENSQMLQDGFLYQAGVTADKLLEKKPQSCNYNYRRGFIYLELSQDFVHATPLLEKAVNETDKNFDAYSANELSAPVDALFHLGRSYHLAENIEKAEEYYKKFLDISNPKSEFVFFAKLKLQQCEIARKLMANPKKVILKNVGSVINSDKPEFSPVISLDGSALYFTSRREWEDKSSNEAINPRVNLHPEDIYVAYKDFDGEWIQPTRMEFCDPIQNEATMAVSPDERRIYIYEDTRGNGDIFYSDFTSNKFQTVEHLDEGKINTNSWEPHCTVTPDGLNMYFVSDRKGGFGGRDIYRVVKLPNGIWSEPTNLGPNINGPLDEDSPFIAVDNKTLYFSSNGANSMGGFDVFVTTRDENNAWSDPINLGYPLNSAGDDLFYTTTVDGLTGYLTSFRADGFGEKDIYEIQNDFMGLKNLAVLKGQIHTYGNVPLPDDISIVLRCTNCGDSFDRKVFPRTRDGIFLSTLEACREYEMIFSYENGKKEFHKETFKTECTNEYQEVYREVWLDVEKQAISRPYLLTGTVRDNKTKELLSDVNVTIVEKNETAKIIDAPTKKDGSFLSDTLRGKNMNDKFTVEMRLEKAGYITVTYDVPLEMLTESRIEINKLIDLVMVKNEIGNDIGLNIKPIYFDYNKSNIRQDASIELDKIVKIMKDNPSIKIELGSHTDSRGKTEYNRSLSDKRAKSSAAYIISKGIPSNRIAGKGYGESKLKVSDAEINKKIKTEDKEIEHQKNRRTEFIIIN